MAPKFIQGLEIHGGFRVICSEKNALLPPKCEGASECLVASIMN
jgi:hypothetical protein